MNLGRVGECEIKTAWIDIFVEKHSTHSLSEIISTTPISASPNPAHSLNLVSGLTFSSSAYQFLDRRSQA